jgi:outer membrane protein assembly factor BamB
MVASDDPDAIWKPGYTGQVAYRPVAPDPASRARRRRVTVVVAVGVAVATIAVLVVSHLTREGDAAGSSALDRIPTQIRERWTATLARPVTAATGNGEVIVAVAGGELVTLDAGSGTERWRAPAPDSIGEIEVSDGVVVAHDVSPSGQSLVAFDLRDGHRVWSTTLRRAPEVTLVGDSLVVPAFSAGGVVTSVELLEPRTRRRRAAFEGDEITMTSNAVRRRVNNIVEWYDRDTFDLRARLDLGRLGLDRVQTSGVPTDAGLVIATFDRASLLDRDGTVISTVSLSHKLNAPWSLAALDESGRHLVLQGVNASTMLTVRDGTLRELWTRPVAPLEWMVDYSRTILTIRQQDGDEAGLQMVDRSTGRGMFTGQQHGLPTLALHRNGFVAGTEPAEDGSWSVVGYDLEGTELWRLPVPDKGWPTLLPGALLTIDDDPEARATTLTLRS